MTILTAALGIGDAAILAALGYCVVFLGLILLMIVVIIVGKSFTGRKPVEAEEEKTEQTPVAEMPVAPGTAGQLKLHNVDPKTAAMLMAIVADKMGKPINELRFISIKEVK